MRQRDYQTLGLHPLSAECALLLTYENQLSSSSTGVVEGAAHVGTAILG